MTARIYHVALAFQADPEGELHATNVTEAPTPRSAVSRAKKLAKQTKGAVAFSRSANVDLGEYGDAKIHLAIGELPPDVERYVRLTS